jgi:hypothetical protein
MLTQLFLAARQEGASPLPYVRMMIRHGLVACASRLESIKPELATQFLNVTFAEANLSDRFLLSAWGTLDTKMRLSSPKPSSDGYVPGSGVARRWGAASEARPYVAP